MQIRVWELARELNVDAGAVTRRLRELGHPALSVSSSLLPAVETKVRKSFGAPPPGVLPEGTEPSLSSWRSGAVREVTHAGVLEHLRDLESEYPIARQHREALRAIGSQFVYAAPVKDARPRRTWAALCRFSGAIESAFGLTREVMFFYSPHPDLQVRELHTAVDYLRSLDREVTPDLIFMWAPDSRLRSKLDDWSGPRMIMVPLEFRQEPEPIALVTILRDHVFARDLFYETTPVQGDKFFGRQLLLQSLRSDVVDRRAAGLFGLRKAGKTSVLSELAAAEDDSKRIIILRDLESLPSPPEDPIPQLMADLRADLLDQLRRRGLKTQDLVQLTSEPEMADFKRVLQGVFRRLELKEVSVLLLLDEIEYLTPSDSVDIEEGKLPSIPRFLGVLRSLVQESNNFTFLISGLTSAIVESGRLYGRPNPLFSWTKAYFLSPFVRAEADDLAITIASKMGIEIEDGALEALHDASGGHAFLYRHLASTVVKELPIDVFRRRLRRADVLRSLESWRLLVAGNAREMVNHVKRYYPDEAFLLEVLSTEPESFSMLASDAPSALGHLLSLGLIERSGRGYEPTALLTLT